MKAILPTVAVAALFVGALDLLGLVDWRWFLYL